MKLIAHHVVRRAGVVAGITALSASVLVVSGSPAQAHPAGDRAVNAGATWLNGQFNADGLVDSYYEDWNTGEIKSFVDLGLTADFAFALDAAGGHDVKVAAIADAVAPVVSSWYDSFGTIYTGSAAKAAALAQTAGKDATSFGGQDLPALVAGNVATQAPISGRVQHVNELDYSVDPPVPTDSLNVISQSWAARALAVQGSTLADDVEAFLLDQQCAPGYYRAALTQDKTDLAQDCDSSGDPAHLDTTTITLINLMAVPTPSTEVATSISDGIAWLKTQQAADGSFSAGGTEGVNANTTGLAGWALAKAGEETAATKAATWLRGLQIADIAPCATTLSAENGAVAYTAAALAESRAAGNIAILKRDQFRRATAQALPALASVPAANAPLAISAPATAIEKSTVSVTVSGLGGGETGCVTLGGVAKTVTGTGSDVSVTFDLPAGAAAHTFMVTTVDGSNASASLAATVPATPVPTTPAPVPSVGDLKSKKVVKARKNKFRMRVACEGTTACEATIRVRTARKVAVAGKKKARKVLVAKKSYTLAPGTTKAVVLKVRKPARKVLAKQRVKVRAVASAPETRRVTAKFWLKTKNKNKNSAA